ncbi:TPA: hypothetical protein ACN7TG_002906 [Klebsiella pneumoniae]
MNKSTITRERLQEIAEDGFLKHGESKELARMALVAMDSEPVAWRRFQETPNDGGYWILYDYRPNCSGVEPLYRHAQPAQISALKLPPKLSNDRESSHELNTGVDTWNRCIDEVAKINGEMIIAGRLDGLHPSTAALVNDFATALAEKLRKAELKYGYSNAWTNNGWMTDCLADFHRHIAKGDPRDVAAYCAFMWYHGWKTEAAQPAPVVPDAYVRDEHGRMMLNGVCEPKIGFGTGWNACRAAMLAAAPQPQNAPQNIPEIIPNELIAAVNRLLDSNGSRGCYNAIKCYDAHIEVERLLAAARQEDANALIPVVSRDEQEGK